MDERLYNLHLRAGLVSGREKTCGKKTAYAAEDEAVRASVAHNRWEKRRHDVEPYPCAFCKQWHIGRVMPIELLESIAAGGESPGEAPGGNSGTSAVG
jgi:hypothetical protein